MKPIYKSKE